MQLAKEPSPVTRNYWRVVLALATKDIIDAIKNKTTLTVILGLAMMMLTVQALPLLLSLDDRPRVAIYDAERTGLADELRREGTVQVRELRAAEDALAAARESSGARVSLVLPPDWAESTGPLTFDGYIVHWISPQDANELTARAEQALTAITGRPTTIQTETVYPTLESGGHTNMLALGLVLATTLITTILVPYLILDEKTSHTLDALRVSPATITQVLLGKGLAGTVYGLLAAAVLLAFNLSLVIHWGVMLLAVLTIVLFGVGLGLLVGTLVENEGAVQLWVGLLAVFLMFPLVLLLADSNPIPAWLRQSLDWLPTGAAFHLVRLSLTNAWPAAELWPRVAAALAAIAVVFAAAGLRLRGWEG